MGTKGDHGIDAATWKATTTQNTIAATATTTAAASTCHRSTSVITTSSGGGGGRIQSCFCVWFLSLLLFLKMKFLHHLYSMFCHVLMTEHFMSRPILETTLLRTIGRQFTSRTTMDPHLEAVLGLTKNGTSIMSDIRFGIAQRLLKWQPFLLQQWRGQCIIIHMRMIIIGHDR